MKRVRRFYRAIDNVGLPCGCTECQEAGVTQEPQRRVPGPLDRPLWLHGWALRRWLDAANTAFATLGHRDRLPFCDCGSERPESARYGSAHLSWCATQQQHQRALRK